MTRAATLIAKAPGGHGSSRLPSPHSPLTGLELYRSVEVRTLAAGTPLIPGALVSPALMQLHGRMQYIMAEASQTKLGIVGSASSASREIPLAAAIQFMQRELSTVRNLHIMAVARSRDTFAQLGESKELSWRLAGIFGFGREGG